MFKYNFILLKNNKNGNNNFYLNEIKNNQNFNNVSIIKLSLFLLLIINFRLFHQYLSFQKDFKDNNNPGEINLNDYGSNMNNYSLYELYKYEQITLLISGINNWKINEQYLLNFINSLEQQTLKEIQIIFILYNTSNLINNLITKYTQINEKMVIFSPSENLEFNIIYLMNLIKGKFIMFLENLIIFEKKEFEALFSITKGKEDNIFEGQIQNNSFYLVKTKILRNLIDDGLLFNNSKSLINFFISLPKPKLNYISISICPNDYYVPLTYVSMISILSSKEEFTFISFYLIISKDFQKKNIDFLLSLYEQFDYFNITFVEMDDRYNSAYISRRMTIQTYFRFSLGELFPHLNRILYLDSDIIVYKDLNKLFNLNFNGKMVLGQVTGCNRSKKTGIYHINNGILLFNLVQMRKMKIEEKVIQILKKKINLLIFIKGKNLIKFRSFSFIIFTFSCKKPPIFYMI